VWRQAMRALLKPRLKPWHASLATQYSGAVATLTTALVYGLSAFPPVAWAALVSLSFSWWAQSWMVARDNVIAMSASAAARGGDDVPSVWVSSSSPPSAVAVSSAVSSGVATGLALSCAFHGLLYGGGAFGGDGAAAVWAAAAMPFATALVWAAAHGTALRHRRSHKADESDVVAGGAWGVPASSSSLQMPLVRDLGDDE